MKRSDINAAHTDALRFFAECSWVLPPNPRWDITDFGLGEFERYGLVLVNLSEEPEYSEKIMVARSGQIVPAHFHRRKKEDIICRQGGLVVRVWDRLRERFDLLVNGEPSPIDSGGTVELHAGERVTLPPEIVHEFWSVSERCLIGEVATANDDGGDNFFLNDEIGRFPGIEEDETPQVCLVSEQ